MKMDKSFKKLMDFIIVNGKKCGNKSELYYSYNANDLVMVLGCQKDINKEWSQGFGIFILITNVDNFNYHIKWFSPYGTEDFREENIRLLKKVLDKTVIHKPLMKVLRK